MVYVKGERSSPITIAESTPPNVVPPHRNTISWYMSVFAHTSYSSPYSARPAFELRYSFLDPSITVPFSHYGDCSIPLIGPFHSVVRDNERRDHIEDLISCSSYCVRDSPREVPCERSLAISADGVGDYAFAGRSASCIRVPPNTNVPSTENLSVLP